MYASMFGFGTISLVVIFLLTAIAVLRYFLIVRHNEGPWHTRIAPILSILGMGLLLVLSSIYYAMSIGAPQWVATAEQVLLVVIIVAGIIVGLHLRKSRPEAYRRIGNNAGDHHDVRRATGQLPTVTKQQ